VEKTKTKTKVEGTRQHTRKGEVQEMMTNGSGQVKKRTM